MKKIMQQVEKDKERLTGYLYWNFPLNFYQAKNLGTCENDQAFDHFGPSGGHFHC